MLCRGFSIEKSNFLFTSGCEAARAGVLSLRRRGEDIGPTDLRGDELRVVLIGDRALGGGNIGLPFRRADKTSVGSGIVPM